MPFLRHGPHFQSTPKIHNVVTLFCLHLVIVNVVDSYSYHTETAELIQYAYVVVFVIFLFDEVYVHR